MVGDHDREQPGVLGRLSVGKVEKDGALGASASASSSQVSTDVSPTRVIVSPSSTPAAAATEPCATDPTVLTLGE